MIPGKRVACRSDGKTTAREIGCGLGQGGPRHGGRETAPTGRNSEARGGGDLVPQTAATPKGLLRGLRRWCFDVRGLGELSTEQWELLLGLLPEIERVRVLSFLRENDRSLALESRLLQRALVSQVFRLNVCDVDIRRTPEVNTLDQIAIVTARESCTSLDGSMPCHLKNWKFNVFPHGQYVAISSEPACPCGVDLVDTKRRANEPGPAGDYLRYFTEHFTDTEWETIKRPDDDESNLRRFYLDWGLKEAFMKAVGQGLGCDLRRISFVAGDWLNCCSLSKEDDDIGSRLRWCSCPRTSAVTTAAATTAPERVQSGGDSDAVERGDKVSGGGRPDKDAMAERVGKWRTALDWSFQVFPFPNGYAECLARGPPSACSPSGQAAGITRDPNPASELLALGQSLPQLRFRAVKLEEIISREASGKLVELRSRGERGGGQAAEAR